ncbi:MAG: 2-oxoglutarate dehydrogenase complex dihydrolipoyllysine-residue succinyltransferase [Bacteroidales bacterium]|nr:2-oxoglutarate dehydrogenase complex dihydrolipoyllysine-residue succinyltransferase [Bacteroidales bacterium]HOI32232.1 2-oxoglutarate dehydrogenase complex dihydrolipoyllysine-residue succinyltransferase [Bacteroidales bacterium]
MAIEIKVPSPGESINEVQLANWLVEDGSYVEKDQDIAEIDSDKATLSIAAEVSGTIHFKASIGDTLEVGAVIASLDADENAPSIKSESKSEPQKTEPKPSQPEKVAEKVSEPTTPMTETLERNSEEPQLKLSPLARELMKKQNINEQELIEFFKHYRVDSKDVNFYQENKDKHAGTKQPVGVQAAWGGTRKEDRKKMSMLRKKLSQRLVSVKNETAMLTTFNEVNMTPIMEIRKKYKEVFKEKHAVGLGFMSFFTKAVTEALHHFPQVNARIDGDEIVYYDYADISIAVSGPKGLVVPVIHNAETLSLAEIERKIKELATKARDNKLSLDEMTGGTFTITNGGVFGSMLSTPIINPPQSAILGMHNIVERPIAVNGKVEIHPIMYVALSYDHRIIDGRESVGFLVKVKELLENPVNMLFGSKEAVEVLLGV